MDPMSSWVVPSSRFSVYVAGMTINRVYILLTLLLAACSTSTSVEVGSTALLTTNPAAGTAGVDVKAQIEVRFDSPIAPGAGHPIALQVGDCPGPVVAGTWSRTADGMGLRFTSTQPLDPSTRYTIHVGGGLTDADGAIINLDLNGLALGGTWVTLDMVMGMTGMGMGQSHSGPDWLYLNGMYGLAFGFNTGP